MLKKSLLVTFYFVLAFTPSLFAHDDDYGVRQTVYNNGIGIGSALAIAISWSRNKSLLWAILHGIFSWFYVIYYYFTQHNKDNLH